MAQIEFLSDEIEKKWLKSSNDTHNSVWRGRQLSDMMFYVSVTSILSLKLKSEVFGKCSKREAIFD
jgi:hypothetical protein